MSMNNNAKSEKVQRLKTAYSKTKNMLESQEFSREFHLGTDIARRWTLITSTYSGLEQAIKYLIAEEKSYTINQLFNIRVLNNNNNRFNYPYRTHDLASLFGCLEESTKSVCREYYAQYQSLHSYIKFERLDDFLSEVSGTDGKGYERWRYTLIEDETQLPRNSTEAMLAIWGTCVKLAEFRINNNEKVRMLDEELNSELSEKIADSLIEVQRACLNAGQASPDLEQEANNKLFQNEHPLNIFARIFRYYECFKSHGLSDVSIQLSYAVDNWKAKILEFGKTAGISSLRWFIERSQGRTSDGESIRWNSDTRRFESVPWSLDLISAKTLPAGAITIEHYGSSRHLQDLKIIANECGYKVRENRSQLSRFNLDNDVYFRILEVSDGDTSGPVITIWEKSTFAKDCSFVVELEKNNIKKPVRDWIERYRMLSQFGEFKIE